MSHPPPDPGARQLPHDAYRPLSGRQRLLIVLLGVGTSIGGVLTLLDPPGGVVRKAPPAPTVPECAASSPAATTGCVGGLATVLPPAPTPSAASR